LLPRVHILPSVWLPSVWLPSVWLPSAWLPSVWLPFVGPPLLRFVLGFFLSLGLLSAPCRGQPATEGAVAPVLEKAWQAFTAGKFALAEQLYRQAAALSKDNSDAELGIGWSLQRQERCAEARLHFQRARGDGRWDEQSALQGLALCPAPRRLRLYPALTQGVYGYRQHPHREYATATTARLGALVHERWLLGAAYRFSYFSTRDPGSAPWLQHDVYLSAGYTARLHGVSLHYGVLHGALSSPVAFSGSTASDYADTSHHIGATARYSPFGDGLLTLALSMYPTDTVVRSELSWWLPVVPGLQVRPAAAMQWSGGTLRPSGALTLSYQHTRFGLFLGGKYGTELRPAQLAHEVVYNGPERIPYGLWTGLSVHPGAGFTLTASYACDRLLTDSTDVATGATSTTASDAHYGTLSMAREF